MNNLNKRVLVLGATGMLGNAIFKILSKDKNLDVYGTIRSTSNVVFCPDLSQKLIVNNDLVKENRSLEHLLDKYKPNIVINCIGIIKQSNLSLDPLSVIPANSLLPHRVALQCQKIKAKLIHISTDCVYSGKSGMYVETDISDATDLYGRTKLIGEVDYPNTITLRTSIIGHEPNKKNLSLVDWFIAEQRPINGYVKVFFSGLTCIELANIVHDYILPLENLCGIYHLSSEPISKYELLKKISKIYGINKTIIPCDKFSLNRSLNSTKFKNNTGYKPKDWNTMLNEMKKLSYES